MKTALTIALLAVTTTAAFCQETDDSSIPTFTATSHCEESCNSQASVEHPMTAVAVHQVGPSRMQRLRARVAHAARLTGHLTQQAIAAAVQAAATGMEAYYQSAAYSSYYSPTTTTSSTDSCYHGYTYGTCPYGSEGTAYATPYISGPSSTRMRSDYLGGYRFYNTNGATGTARPSYMGGYRINTWSNTGNYSVYTAGTPSLRVGHSSW